MTARPAINAPPAAAHTARRRQRRRWPTRRAVASVLAMMFLVLFGSLAVAMAIASKGNLRTAHTHIHVVRAMSAAETGLDVARARIEAAAARFVVAKGEVSAEFAGRIWNGTTDAGDGDIRVLPPADGHSEFNEPAGIAAALVSAFGADINRVTYSGGVTDPEVGPAPDGTDPEVYALDGWVYTPAVAIDGSGLSDSARPAAFQVVYAPLANGTDVRILVTGFSSVGQTGSDYHYGYSHTEGRFRPLARTISQDVRLVKEHSHAILSPSRVMIGKNVNVTGPIGALYEDTSQELGRPVVMRSDFYGLDPVLDDKLDDLYEGIAAHDVDGDNRLRLGHIAESQGIPSGTLDYDGDGTGDNAFSDASGDGYVDDFDVFLTNYDANRDGRLVLSSALTEGTPAEGLTPEFTADDDLALLLDARIPDRNHNGVSGFTDTNRNGRWDDGESITDYDARTGTYPDRVLGWRDGFLDRRDRYAKLNGRLAVRVSAAQWNEDQGDYQPWVQGSMQAPAGESAVLFGLPEDELPAVNTDTFSDAQTPLQLAADGSPFEEQVATQLGIGVNQLATYTEENTDPTRPRYWRADLDDAYVFGRTGRHLYEKMPFNSPQYADWYYRPRYENMTFRNVQIPRGTNALFINCTFIGVTWVRTYVDNSHTNWTLYGRMQWDAGAGRPVEVTDPLDKSDFQRYFTGNVTDGPANYDQFPDPPVIDGQTRTGAARNTKRYSNNIRFHDCLVVGTVVSDTPSDYTHVRNKLVFTGSTRFASAHPEHPDDDQYNPDDADMAEIRKSSLMVPNYSVDIGSFNSPTDTFANGPAPQSVNLQGTIVAGILDARGSTTIDGTLMLTFAPTAGEGPLEYNGQPVGNPADFNATLGYFGPEDGDEEAVNPEELPFENGQRVVGWDLDGDGIADLDWQHPPSDEQREAGATAVPFYGFGRITITWNPELPMPDGIMLPLGIRTLDITYGEGHR